MSITNPIMSRVGQFNAAGDVNAGFMTLFGGEVLTEFERTTLFKDKHFVRAISNQRSASFPFIGRATAFYHTAGQFIEGNPINHGQKIITVDDLLVAPVEISNIEEAQLHYDVRQPYSQELGRILANTYDANVARVIALSARATSPVTGRPGGSVITAANILTDAAVAEAALFRAAQTLDEKDVGSADRYSAWRPAQFYLLAQRDRLVDTQLGASGSVAQGVVDTVAGLPIMKTNHVPSANDTANTAIAAKYRADYSKTAALVWTKMAAATVELVGISMEAEYQLRYKTHFMLASYAVGHDWLRPDCAIEIRTP